MVDENPPEKATEYEVEADSPTEAAFFIGMQLAREWSDAEEFKLLDVIRID